MRECNKHAAAGWLRDLWRSPGPTCPSRDTQSYFPKEHVQTVFWHVPGGSPQPFVTVCCHLIVKNAQRLLYFTLFPLPHVPSLSTTEKSLDLSFLLCTSTPLCAKRLYGRINHIHKHPGLINGYVWCREQEETFKWPFDKLMCEEAMNYVIFTFFFFCWNP